MFQRFRDVWDPTLDNCPVAFYCTETVLALDRFWCHSVSSCVPRKTEKSVSIDLGKDERLEEVGAGGLVAIPKMRRKDCKKRAIPL
jgi:hypothetical protein